MEHGFDAGKRSLEDFRHPRTCSVLRRELEERDARVSNGSHFIRPVPNPPIPGDDDPSTMSNGPEPLTVRRIRSEEVGVNFDVDTEGSKSIRNQMTTDRPIQKEDWAAQAASGSSQRMASWTSTGLIS